MPIIYNSNKIIPAPLVSINKTYTRSESGEKIGVRYQIVVTGNLVAYKGSPTSTLAFHTTGGYPADESVVQSDPDERLDAIIRKQEALRELFAEDGHAFEIQPFNGDTPLKCYPKVESIQFGQGQWYDLCEYTITLQAEELLGVSDAEDVSGYVVSASEQWNIQEGENESVFTLSHNISAQGIDQYGATGLIRRGWENARNYVQALQGITDPRIEASGVLNLDPGLLTGYNHARAENVDEKTGSYSIVENWVLSQTDTIDNFNVDSSTDFNTGLTNVTINGTITGLNTKDSDHQITTTKFAAASGYYESIKTDLLSRAQTYSNITLNVVPLTETVGRNIRGGTMTYARSYDDRPSNLIPGAKTESIQVSDEFQGDVFAAIPVIGRTTGPILQNMNTKTQRSRSLVAQLTFAPSGTYGDPPSVQSIIDLVEPTGSQVFKSQDGQVWDYKIGSLSRNITWVFSVD